MKILLKMYLWTRKIPLNYEGLKTEELFNFVVLFTVNHCRRPHQKIVVVAYSGLDQAS